MSEQSDVTVKIDDRVRLMSAVLAATTYPEDTQKIKPHGTHAHARAALKHSKDFVDHPAVKSTQGLLDQNTPLEALFTLVLMMTELPELNLTTAPSWMPAGYDAQLRDFYTTAKLADFWKKEKSVWDRTVREGHGVFNNITFKDFLTQFLPPIEENLVFMPNISYPAAHDIGIRVGNELICIAPPPLAWGDSPPWPYDEPTMLTHSYQVALTVFGRALLINYLRANPDQMGEITKDELPVADQFKAQHPTWEDQFTALFSMAAVAMYFESHVSELEYKSYVLMQKKAYGMALLPGTVSVMRRYLKEVGGKYTNLIEFLPIFPKQLRVAQKIVTL